MPPAMSLENFMNSFGRTSGRSRLLVLPTIDNDREIHEYKCCSNSLITLHTHTDGQTENTVFIIMLIERKLKIITILKLCGFLVKVVTYSLRYTMKNPRMQIFLR